MPFSVKCVWFHAPFLTTNDLGATLTKLLALTKTSVTLKMKNPGQGILENSECCTISLSEFLTLSVSGKSALMSSKANVETPEASITNLPVVLACVSFGATFA